VLAKSPESTC